MGSVAKCIIYDSLTKFEETKKNYEEIQYDLYRDFNYLANTLLKVDEKLLDIEDENIMLLEISDSFVFHYIVKKINIDKNSNITITTNELKSNDERVFSISSITFEELKLIGIALYNNYAKVFVEEKIPILT